MTTTSVAAERVSEFEEGLRWPGQRGIRCYLAGPMSGYERQNWDAFDEARDWLKSKGWDVISPADIDRSLGFDLDTAEPPPWWTEESAMHIDLHEVTHPLNTGIVLLPGWVFSKGARKEVYTAMHCGLDVWLYEPDGVIDGAVEWKNRDKRLVWVAYSIVELMMQTNEDQQEADEKYYEGTDGEHRVVSETGGAKGQKNGLRYDLIPSEALKEVAKVYGHGVKKYSANNWRLGYDYSLSTAALERHYHAWKQGEIMDGDGFMHLAAVVFHTLTLIYRDKFQPEWDDVRV